ncbi:hypothetical protein [Sinomonas terrae]|uniref:Uncharacterized protein n=1 Tax=Sinomonas terrae TaxID=2908838 RepID=A0ABS9U4C8_9MICC|nr:hypothetical protein [Sinomonas terrae]MCH6471546.1 hypothetical protein [Sinomonas terrae]
MSTFEQNLNEWAAAAVPILEGVTGDYGAYITYGELRDRIFDETRIRTDMLMPNFSSRLLNKVIHLGNERGLPQLTSLVVHASDGKVGEGFDEVLRVARKDLPATELERETAPAAARLDCYWKYADDVPADAQPRLTARNEAKVTPQKKAAGEPRPVCPVHGLELSASGVCAFCD